MVYPVMEIKINDSLWRYKPQVNPASIFRTPSGTREGKTRFFAQCLSLTEAVEVDQESTKANDEEVNEKKPGTEGTKNEDNLVYVFIKSSLFEPPD